ncbi:cysteine-rich venom protein Mr30-like [Haliotis cracherodii]|uniref:cysteine-rich venom protein Mr30-like n=1 Tax=Haliotis cracherodii TaxID=6455 RepID=UPI0039E9F0E7
MVTLSGDQRDGHDNLVSDIVFPGHNGVLNDSPHDVTLPKKNVGRPKRTQDTCTTEYAAIRGHTMCLQDNSEVTSYGVAAQDQEDIVTLHNELRGRVEPPATDLGKLVWDSKLAAVSEKWARQCKMEHDHMKSIPEYGLEVGQNIAGGYLNWRSAIMAWYNEVSLYRFGQNPNGYLGRDGWKKIGHYTQIVQNVTFLIGCGYAHCPNTKFGRYYVCNYGSGQNRISKPYTRGARCSSCPNTCKDGLCDCGGKACFNGGYLDTNTCTCTCQQPYSGPTCQQLNCPPKDSFYCGRSLVPKDCRTYYNVPQLCPYMCGICGSPSSNTTAASAAAVRITPSDQASPVQPTAVVQPSSGEFTSAFGCVYAGNRASKVECRDYGDHGNDMSLCASMGGSQITCDHCQQFYNIKTDYCPVMCGLCDAPCGGKQCLNGGRLDTDTCKCTCKTPYAGTTCQTANCPAKDPFHCTLYRLSYCELYVNVPSECPFLCGIC